MNFEIEKQLELEARNKSQKKETDAHLNSQADLTRNQIQPEQKAQSLEKIARAYSSTAWWYDLRGFIILSLAYRSTITSQVRFFANNFGAKHLEAAIGTGTLFELVLKWRKFKGAAPSDITGFDYAPKMLQGAIHRLRKQTDIKLELADVTSLKYADNTFDTVNCANSIHCFPEVQDSFREIYRVLKPDGTFAGNVLLHPKGNGHLDRIAKKINNWGIQKGILYTPYHQEKIKTLLQESGFEVIKENVYGNCYDFLARKVKA